jgi:predicted patatin/cPLA2 family phospholipase
MKALVISGGASKMPFSIGCAQELLKENSYNLLIGTSAGGIVCSMASVSKLDILLNTVLNFRLKDVFNTVPIKENGKLTFIGFCRLLLNKTSIGKNKRFRNNIKSLFKIEDFNTLSKSKIVLKVGVTNFNSGQIEYPCNLDNNYEDFMDWVYTSTNLPIFTEPMYLKNSWYFDGGVIDYAGISEAIKSGASDIDVVFHSPINIQEKPDWKPKNIIEIAKRTIDISLNMVAQDDVIIAQLLADNKKVNIRYFAPEKELSETVYNLNKNDLMSWYKLGIEASKKPSKTLYI